ncbi:multiubiquitin domain-containing protein [Bradyrhizobium sp. Rc3b]|uniref:multiubiquitin domain-containing protein n=1 Tax=Bradyrhizobium sp. Rc3b TaxID=1855322 RepID=UPI000B840600|nr:multiubiquitin domain-containing protein [Bradyrhizobium sp. Rc3b]
MPTAACNSRSIGRLRPRSHLDHREVRRWRKPITIYVNGTAYEVPKDRISYEELMALIGAPALPDDQRYSVQFSKGQSGKPTGTLIEGETVQVKKGMEFDVTPANRS